MQSSKEKIGNISYLSKVSVTLEGRAKIDLFLVCWVRKGDRKAVKA